MTDKIRMSHVETVVLGSWYCPDCLENDKLMVLSHTDPWTLRCVVCKSEWKTPTVTLERADQRDYTPPDVPGHSTCEDDDT